MEFEDFDLGPDELGIMLGMAEELAEEQKERYRLYREMDEEHDKFDDIDEEIENKTYNIKRKPQGAFEKYIDDIISGKRSLWDSDASDYNYSESIEKPKSVKKPIPIKINDIQIYQHHLVSKRFLKLLGEIINRYPNNNIRTIYFNAEGYPKKKGNQIFAVYIRKSRTVVINLQRHFDNAAAVSIDINSSYSIRALFWYSMINVFLHELRHSMTQIDDDDPTGTERESVEKEASSWSDKEIKLIAKAIDIEPPLLSEEPFLHACFNELLQNRKQNGYDDWVAHQKLLIDSNVMYWDSKTHLSYPTMKHFWGVAQETADKKDDMRSMVDAENDPNVLKGKESYSEDSINNSGNMVEYISTTQDEALNWLKGDEKLIFVTGEAGTGKSYLLQKFRNISNLNIAVVAPSGIAAINVKGATIHSFFNFPPKIIQQDDVKKAAQNKKYKILDVLIIDEISMVRSDILDGIDLSLRINREKMELPFGGVKVIVFGDLFQLPPVVSSNTEKEYFKNTYSSPHFFSANCLLNQRLLILELNKIFRQTDSEFISILNKIRNNDMDDYCLNRLNKNIIKYDALLSLSDHIILTTTNKAAKYINDYRLEEIQNKEFIFRADITGNFNEKSFPTEETLRLKKDALVKWVNGDLAKIVKLENNRIEVQLENNIYRIEKVTWENIKYDYDSNKKRLVPNTTGTFTQYPLKLAYAMTIHKSQGKTIPKLVIDFGSGTFAHGQAYTAISRGISLDNIYFARKVTKDDFMFDRRVIDSFINKSHLNGPPRRKEENRYKPANNLEILSSAYETEKANIRIFRTVSIKMVRLRYYTEIDMVI